MTGKHHFIYTGLITFIFFLLFSATPVFGTNLEELSNNADVILFGRVVKVECRWAKSSMNILSRAQFRVKICVKGKYAAGDHVEIETYGGVIRGMKQKIPNCAAFRPGEYALVFLKGGQGDVFYVTNGKEGKISFARKKGMKSVAERKKLNRIIRNIQLALK
ncbi:MAG: hypothetical protein GXP58_11560 [Deltaproteobacteria bacterium]|nr:hypothetical protein [Deltaproteobacteria bacterium]